MSEWFKPSTTKIYITMNTCVIGKHFQQSESSKFNNFIVDEPTLEHPMTLAYRETDHLTPSSWLFIKQFFSKPKA